LSEDTFIKLYHWIAKKRYLKGKYVYKYERLYVPIPKIFHKKFRALLKQRLKIEVAEHKGRLGIFLTPDKTLSHAESAPDKT
jgi:hypothetical protein